MKIPFIKFIIRITRFFDFHVCSPVVMVLAIITRGKKPVEGYGDPSVNGNLKKT